MASLSDSYIITNIYARSRCVHAAGVSMQQVCACCMHARTHLLHASLFYLKTLVTDFFGCNNSICLAAYFPSSDSGDLYMQMSKNFMALSFSP